MRVIIDFVRAVYQRIFRKPDGGLSAVEYEAITLIAQEGRGALAKAREQAAYCRRRGSEQGHEFWTKVANEVSLRTSGKPAQPVRAGGERKSG
ncbi:MAG: hypothetical protein K2Y29_06385 [Beijerinckiaceae bacterium]|nr:hypothetical protein [Beijerinckiaceae bacterium]